MTLVLSSQEAAVKQGAAVDLTTVVSLRLTVDEVLFRLDDPNETDVSVFQGSVDVDLLDLLSIAEVLGSIQAPFGDYTGVTLVVSNPELVLVSDPNVVITNVALPDSGNLRSAQSRRADFTVGHDRYGDLVARGAVLGQGAGTQKLNIVGMSPKCHDSHRNIFQLPVISLLR